MVSSDAKNLYISYLLLDSLLTAASEHFTGAALKLRLIIMCKIFNLSTGLLLRILQGLIPCTNLFYNFKTFVSV